MLRPHPAPAPPLKSQISNLKSHRGVGSGEPEHWQQLAEALRIHGQTHEVKRVHETGFGPRFEVEGKLNAPDGRSPRVRSVWQQDQGAVAPRLITAYPLGE